MTLREVLDEQRWFRRKIWDADRAFEPWVYRWDRTRGQLIKAPVDDIHNQMSDERQFSPFEIMANDWNIIR